MKKSIGIGLAAGLLAGQALAATELESTYRFYDTKDGPMHMGSIEAKSTIGSHILFAKYAQFRNFAKDYDLLHKTNFAYLYMGDKLLAGAMIGSNSDKVFGSIDVMSAGAFGGYSLYEKKLGEKTIDLPNGKTHTHTRKFKIYGGALVSTTPIYHSHILPFIAMNYEGEQWYFSFGIPTTKIGYRPTEKHDFCFEFMDVSQKLSYTYKPFKGTALSASYETEVENFKTVDEASENKWYERESRWYYREWLKVKAEQKLGNRFKAYAEYGYQLKGRYKYGKSYSKNHTETLADGSMYEIGLSLLF